jgi:Fungal specific transcription factor domain
LDFLGARAKALLELELDYPSVATVQALVILSNHEIGNGKDGRGWLFSGKDHSHTAEIDHTWHSLIRLGMAMRLAFDLALHLDMSYYVSKREITQADADLRRTVFWSAYAVDQ